MVEVFGKYELIRRIGIGGMAEVYQGRVYGAQGFVRDIAIKRILPALTEDPDFELMFVNEARVAVRLRHANIVQVLDFDQVDGHYFIAMEWIDGADLERLANAAKARGREVPWTLAVHVGVEALKGLHYAHTRADRGQEPGIIHRDISPQNVLVSSSGEVKITDFGIAKVAALASATRPGVFKGKLAYMSPEQARGDAVDARTDLYSLGVVLWELISGQRAHVACETEGELIAAVRRAEIPPLRQVKPELPDGLDAAVHRMLAPAKEQRFDNAAEALSALGACDGTGDVLGVAAFMAGVLLTEAERERKGETEQLPQRETSGSGPPQLWDAPTHLREAGGERQASEADLEVAPQAPSKSEAVATRPGVRRTTAELSPQRGWAESDARRMAATSAGALMLGLLGIVLGTLWLRASLVEARASREGASVVASVTVRTDPPATRIGVNALSLNTRPPLTIAAEPGARLQIKAMDGVSVTSRDVLFGPDGPRLVMLQLPRSEALAARAPTAPRDRPPSPPAAEETRPSPPAKVRRVRRPRRKRRARAAARPVASKPRRGGARPPQVPLAEHGTLTVIVSPWAYVELHGRAIGITPIRGRRIPPGDYRLKIYNPTLEKSETLHLRVAPRAPVRIRRTWAD